MQINEFNPLLPSVRRHDIVFHRSGRIDISSNIVRQLNISPGDVINLMESDSEVWLYVCVSTQNKGGRYEAQCSPTKPGSRNFRAWSKRLCSRFVPENSKIKAVRFASGETQTINGFKSINIITTLPL